MKTEQEKKQHTFDHVVTNLLRQGVKSMAANGYSCMYRGENGTKCAAGWCIPDENYNPEFEDTAIGVPEMLDVVADEFSHDPNYMQALQQIHDLTEVDEWPSEFRTFAEREGLSTLALDTQIQ